ncbi:MAG: 2-oxo acid dehydrogenase subunit E2 [Anaerolineaceae bacterium]|nr:2-oxo acid dehydrogenase subunit E2 [Anaerolineaceae bacterium]
MTEELFIPKLGQTVEEVVLIGWLVEDGSKVEFGTPVLEVETDKAIFPIEANAKGFLHIGPFAAGDTLAVLTVVATIGKAEEQFSSRAAPDFQPVKVEPVVSEHAIAQSQESAQLPGQKQTFVSPRARRLALEKGVDTSLVIPTGGNGMRVREQDVITFLHKQPKVTPVARRMAEVEGVDLRQLVTNGDRITKADVQGALNSIAAPSDDLRSEDIQGINRTVLGGVRKVIAERMAESARNTARVTLFSEVDATGLVQLRGQLKARFEKQWGAAPGYNDLLIKICAAALTQHPEMNARLVEGAIEQIPWVNIGVAVDTERGLLVPVVKDADQSSLRKVSTGLRQLVERARSGRSLPDDLTGGTFTITNLGMYGIDGFTPVINLPECAILGVGRIAPRPVYVGEALERREMMILSLAFDHRLVDGAAAARFLQTVASLIESPALLTAYL